MINIANNEIKFNDLEEKMWKKKMQEGLDELREQLRKILIEFSENHIDRN